MLQILKQIKYWLRFSLVTTLVVPITSLANDNVNTPYIGDLTVQPDNCIALHQGQVCYQQLTFDWHMPITGDFCLYRHDQTKPLTCWQDNQTRQFINEFESTKNTVFQIRQRDNSRVLAQTQVRVAWVYQSKRKSTSGWRLF